MQCTDFEISPTNMYIATCGQEGTVKVFDYLMRGTKITPSSQAFLGHFNSPKQLIWAHENLYSISDINGIFQWQFNGDTEIGYDEMKTIYEEITEQNRVERGGALSKDPCKPSDLLRTLKEEEEERPLAEPRK